VKTMTANTHAKATHSSTVHHVSTPTEKETVMSTKSHSQEPVHAASTEIATPPPVAFVVAGPPSTVSIPQVEYAPASPGEFKNVVPRAAERAALAQALKDLAAFTTYQEELGTSAPSYAEAVQAFTVGSQWTATRAQSELWDGYCVVQQGLAWRAIRLVMAQLVPVFKLAATANPKLLTQFPGLASLLGAKQAIARKGASTKKLNQKAVAEGKEPVHGAVGKRRQKKAEKAAAAAVQSSGTAAPAAPVTTVPRVVAAQANGVGTGSAH